MGHRVASVEHWLCELAIEPPLLTITREIAATPYEIVRLQTADGMTGTAYGENRAYQPTSAFRMLATQVTDLPTEDARTLLGTLRDGRAATDPSLLRLVSLL